MPIFRLTPRAEADFLDIATYTLQTWGEAQAIRYLNDLEDCCRMLAQNPTVGRPCEDIQPGFRRFESGRHVLFYIPTEDGILVVRALHHRMLPKRHLK